MSERLVENLPSVSVADASDEPGPWCEHTVAAMWRTFSPLRLILIQFGAAPLRDVLSSLQLNEESVTECDSASEGLRALSKRRADLVLLWVGSPSSGVRVCATLRAGGVALPILCIADRVDPHLEISLLDAGADDVVEILARERLRHTAFSLLRRSRREYPVELGSGVQFDCFRRLVVVDGAQFSLTPATLALFQVLAIVIGQWISVESILRSLDLKLSGRTGSDYVRQRARALRKACGGSLSVTFSASRGVRMNREAF